MKIEEVPLVNDLQTTNEEVTEPGNTNEPTIFKFCPSCGFNNENSFKFCPGCGSSLLSD